MADQLSCAKPLDWDAPVTEVLSLTDWCLCRADSAATSGASDEVQ